MTRCSTFIVVVFGVSIATIVFLYVPGWAQSVPPAAGVQEQYQPNLPDAMVEPVPPLGYSCELYPPGVLGGEARWRCSFVDHSPDNPLCEYPIYYYDADGRLIRSGPPHCGGGPEAGEDALQDAKEVMDILSDNEVDVASGALDDPSPAPDLYDDDSASELRDIRKQVLSARTEPEKSLRTEESSRQPMPSATALPDTGGPALILAGGITLLAAGLLCWHLTSQWIYGNSSS